jgi:hypothetical protein
MEIMRSDMAKVIVERPRTGGDVSFPRSRPDCDWLDMDEWQSRQSIRRPWSHDRKCLNENLAPLRRYLQSQVGRPWSKVYCEICQHMNRNSAVQLHIWQHLMQYVCVDKNYEGYDRGTRDRADFIVHPRTGLLCVNRHRQRWRGQKPPVNANRVMGEGDVQYHRINGVWYEIRLARVPATRHGYDFGLRRHVWQVSDMELNSFYGRRDVYGAAKRQLNKKGIRRLGLEQTAAL